MQSDALIVDAVRTPIGRVGGSLASLPVELLLAPLILSLLQRNNVKAGSIDEVIVGNAAGPGGNPARLALLEAELPVTVPGLTVDRQCGSGLEAINLGVSLVQSGLASAVLAGGVESPSTAPLRAHRIDSTNTASGAVNVQPHFYSRARFSPDKVGDPDMGIAAENVARKYGITRTRQDAFAVASHAKALAAQASDRYKHELVPLRVLDTVVDHDECPREDCTLEKCASLSPAFLPDGTVTAANACPVNDGAAMVLICSTERREQVIGDSATTGSPRRKTSALRPLASSARGVDPNYLGIGPVPAVKSALKRAQLRLSDLAQIEFNEAFAAQVLACVDQLGIDERRLNPGGGALALGHPYGASGAILVTRLLHDMQPGQIGLATLGIGGGMGLASVFECLH